MKAKGNGSAGFSLVEVAISLAILAVGMTGVLALLPVGLDSARQVHAETVAAQIARDSIAKLWMNPALTNAVSFANLPLPADTFWSVDGLQITQTNEAYFWVRHRIGQNPGATTNFCRYYLEIAWPLRATNPVLRQERTFVTDLVRSP